MLICYECEICLQMILNENPGATPAKDRFLPTKDVFPVVHGLNERLTPVPEKRDLVSAVILSLFLNMISNTKKHGLDLFERHTCGIG